MQKITNRTILNRWSSNALGFKSQKTSVLLPLCVRRYTSDSSSFPSSLLNDKEFLQFITKPITNTQQELLKNSTRHTINTEADTLSYLKGLIRKGRVEEVLHYVSTQATPSFGLYTFLIQEFVAVKRMDLVWHIYDAVLENRSTLKPTTQFMKAMLIACFKCVDEASYFDQVLNVMKEENLELTEECYYIIMKHYIKFKNPQKVMEIFKELTEKGFKAGDRIYSLLINLYFRSGQEQQAWRLLDQFKRYNKYPSYFVSLVIVNHLSNHCNEMKRAEKIVKSLPHGILSSYHYVFLVKGYVRNHQYDDALNVIQDMRNRKLAPTLEVYQHLLHEYVDTGDVNGLEALLGVLVADRTLSPEDPMITCYRIAASAVSGQVQKAHSMYEHLLASGCSVQPFAVKYIVRGYLITQNPEEAMEVYEQYSENVDKSDPEIYAQFIRYEANNGNIKAALRYLHEVKVMSVPRSIDYIYLILGAIKGGYLETAMDALNQMHKDGINARYSFLLSVLAELLFSGHFEPARKVFIDIKTKFKHFHGADAYAIMISSHMKHGYFDIAHEYYDQMREAVIEPSEQVYALMFRLYCMMGMNQDVEAMYSELLKNKNIKPTMRIYNSVMRSKVESGNLQAAVDYYRNIIQENNSLIPFPQMMYTLFCGFIAQNDIVKALEIIKQMNSSGDYIAGPRMYSQLATTLHMVGKEEQALKAKNKANHLINLYLNRFDKDRQKVASMIYIAEEDFILRKYLINIELVKKNLRTYSFDHSSPEENNLPTL